MFLLIGPQRPTLTRASSSRCGLENARSLVLPACPLPWPVPAINGSDVVSSHRWEETPIFMSLPKTCWYPGLSEGFRARGAPGPLDSEPSGASLFLPDGVSEQDGGSTLQRVAVTREDSGTYVCWAENRVGRVQAVSFVHVKGRA